MVSPAVRTARSLERGARKAFERRWSSADAPKRTEMGLIVNVGKSRGDENIPLAILGQTIVVQNEWERREQLVEAVEREGKNSHLAVLAVEPVVLQLYSGTNLLGVAG